MKKRNEFAESPDYYAIYIRAATFPSLSGGRAGGLHEEVYLQWDCPI